MGRRERKIDTETDKARDRQVRKIKVLSKPCDSLFLLLPMLSMMYYFAMLLLLAIVHNFLEKSIKWQDN